MYVDRIVITFAGVLASLAVAYVVLVVRVVLISWRRLPIPRGGKALSGRNGCHLRTRRDAYIAEIPGVANRPCDDRE